MNLFWGTQGYSGSQTGQARLVEPGQVDHGAYHVGRCVDDRTGFGLDEGYRLARVEVFLQYDGAGMRHQGEQGIFAAQPPEQRDREPDPVAHSEMQPLADGPHVLDEAVVLKLDPLRGGGRTGGVEQISDVLWLHGFLCSFNGGSARIVRHRQHIRPAQGSGQAPLRGSHPYDMPELTHLANFLQQGQVVAPQEAVAADEHRGVRVFQHVSQFPARCPGIDGDHHPTQTHDGKIGDEPLAAVPHQEGNLVTASDAQRVKPMRKVAYRGPESAIGISLCTANYEFDFRVTFGHFVEQSRNGSAVGDPRPFTGWLNSRTGHFV